jgi:hypothetical protein
MIEGTPETNSLPNLASDASSQREGRSLRVRIRVENVEPLYTVAEVAGALRISYDSARRYFKDLPGVLVRFTPRRYRRSYRTYMIPRSVFQREWEKMASVNGRDEK